MKLLIVLLVALVVVSSAFRALPRLTKRIQSTKGLSMSFETKYFQVDAVDMSGQPNYVVKGGTHLYPACGDAMKESGIKKIGVIGWGSQAPAQAQNLADTLEGTDITVTIGLREGSSSFADAEAVGFSKDKGTLGEMSCHQAI